MQATGGIDDQHIEQRALGLGQRFLRQGHRGLLGIGWEEADIELRRQPFQLQDGGRAINVGAGEQHLLALVFFQPLGELAGRGGFTRALQAGQQNDHGRLRAQVQRPDARAHQRDQLIVDEFDQHLAGRQALVELLADHLAADGVDEALDHRQRDIRLQQRHAHLAQGVGDVLLGEAPATAQALHDALQAFSQFVEHVFEATWGVASKWELLRLV